MNRAQIDAHARPTFLRSVSRSLSAAAAVLVLLTPFFPCTAAAQDEVGEELTLDQVLKRNNDARGGYEAWKKVRTVRMTGTVEAAGQSNPLRVEFKRPKSFRIETEVRGETAIQAFDGTVAWVLPPQAAEAFRLPDEAAQGAAEQADFEGPLMDSEAKGLTLGLTGRKEIDGRNTYRIAYAGGRGRNGTVFLDPETFLEVRQWSERTVQGQDVEVVIDLRDYRKVGDLVIPHTLEQKLSLAPEAQVIRVEKVEINVELDDDRFAFPGEG